MYPIFIAITSLLVQAVVGGTALWLAAKIVKEHLLWKTGFIIALLSSLVSLLPIGGLLTAILSIGLTIFLLYKWSSVDRIWPHAVLLAVVAGVLQIFANFLLLVSLR